MATDPGPGILEPCQLQPRQLPQGMLSATSQSGETGPRPVAEGGGQPACTPLPRPDLYVESIGQQRSSTYPRNSIDQTSGGPAWGTVNLGP